uniref:Uncharacterized protein LOC114327969 n=1 Tax=Diabrotica virgifera virgifera TaxID=50390 RepID=A0A6P7FH85_DIAVI
MSNIIKKPPQSDFFQALETSIILIPSYSELHTLSKTTFNDYTAKYPNHLHIYIDASKQSDGCAFYMSSLDVKEKFKLNSNTSIFSSETIAIIKACQYTENKNLKPINILSDSLSVSVLKSLSSQLDENSVNVNPYIKELKILLSNLTTMQCNIVFTWIKAHIGLENNEKVDQLEKTAFSVARKH